MNDSNICVYHGGSEIHTINNLQLDMSVTTNAFGLVDNYYESMTKDKFEHLATHYPPTPSSTDTALQDAYAAFTQSDVVPIFGNGATELIDIIVRTIPHGNWKTNDVTTQYREYNNACIKTNRMQLKHGDTSAILTVIINPNNPTGDFMDWSCMTEYVDTFVANDGYLIVDESMLFWHGPTWTQHSFLGHTDYVKSLKNERNITVIVIQSWTKIFSSTGMRIGSVVIFDDVFRSRINELMLPWSLNSFGRDYIIHAFSQIYYLERTWKYTRMWRAQIANRVNEIFPKFQIFGAEFTSWLWIDTFDPKIAELIVCESKRIGFPIRHGKQGYNKPSFIRVAVRDVSKMKDWFIILRTIQRGCLHILSTQDIKQRLVYENKNIPIYNILKHEKHNEIYCEALYNYLVGYKPSIQTIIVAEIKDTDKYLLVDGHHRLNAFSRIGYTQIPATVIDYLNPVIWTTQDNLLTKEEITETALRGELMDSKATKHMIEMGNGRFAPVIILSEYTWI
jgi:histidinol-phosphate/aromatic aminotransferase/cobyric acid decarboxylase-like protein